MDVRLPLLAAINLHLRVAEEALSEDPPAYSMAESALDKADESLEELRAAWPQMAENERGLTAQMAKPLSDKAKRLRAGLPKRQAVSVTEAVEDPEQEIEPEA